jgi:hypothetical protein
MCSGVMPETQSQLIAIARGSHLEQMRLRCTT